MRKAFQKVCINENRHFMINYRHEAREAEPKDHDIHGSKNFNSKNRKLHQSTYDRILNVTDGVRILHF